MKKDKVKRKVSLDNDFLLKIYAIIGAVVIWFIMSITLYSSLNKTIHDVPVTIDLKGSTAESYDLEPINNFEGITIDVKVTGERYNIGNLKPEDITATVDVTTVNKPGNYPLGINITSKTKNFEVVSISPEKINVTFDKMMTKEFVISAEAPFYTVPTDYIQESPIANPQTVEILGPQQQIERIDRVVARIEDKETITSSQSKNVSELLLYDSENVQLDTSTFSFSTNSFSVDMKINKVKEIPFNIELLNTPPNFDSSNLKFNYSQNSIQIAGEESVIDSINEVNLGYIDLRDVDIYYTHDFDVLLDPSISNLSDITTVNVSIDPEYLLQKRFSLSKDQIYVIGDSSQYDVSIQSIEIQEVTIVGLDKIIAEIKPEDIIAEVDLSKEEIIPNNYSKTAQIYCPNCNTVWSYGKKDITFTVSEKQQ